MKVTRDLPAAMLSLFFGFAQIRAADIPDGVLPKRQVVGTGVTTTTSSEPTSTSDASTDTTSAPVSETSSDTPSDTTTASQPATTPDTSSTSDAPTVTSESSVSTPTSTDAAPTSSDDSSAAPSSTSVPPSDTTSPSAESSAPASSTSVRTTIAVTTTDDSGSTITSSIATRTLAPVSSSAAVRTESGESSDLVVVGSSTINRSTLSSATTITSALLGEVTQDFVTTTYWTTDGTVGSSVITTNRVVPTTTGFATATVSPKLANGGDGSSGSSLTPQTKAIIGGVVGGVGGAILLGGLAIVAWRLWGKKKRQQIPQDDFMDSHDDSLRREKRNSGLPLSTSTPDRYHTPSGPINTASNF